LSRKWQSSSKSGFWNWLLNTWRNKFLILAKQKPILHKRQSYVEKKFLSIHDNFTWTKKAYAEIFPFGFQSSSFFLFWRLSLVDPLGRGILFDLSQTWSKQKVKFFSSKNVNLMSRIPPKGTTSRHQSVFFRFQSWRQPITMWLAYFYSCIFKLSNLVIRFLFEIICHKDSERIGDQELPKKFYQKFPILPLTYFPKITKNMNKGFCNVVLLMASLYLSWWIT
jgi:hypothetical protein